MPVLAPVTHMRALVKADIGDFSALAAGPHGHPNAAAALGTPPGRRELTLMPRLGFPCPRLAMAAGASFFTGGGAPRAPQRGCRVGDPARSPRTDADTSPRIHTSSARRATPARLPRWGPGVAP